MIDQIKDPAKSRENSYNIGLLVNHSLIRSFHKKRVFRRHHQYKRELTVMTPCGANAGFPRLINTITTGTLVKETNERNKPIIR